MDKKKNIHLFRGKNTLSLSQTIMTWKEKFIEKHGEMNLSDISHQDFHENLGADCMSPGFMGMTRMIIFRDLILKTDKEIATLENTSQSEGVNEGKKQQESINNEFWINIFNNAPESNFFIFIGNQKPVTELEKWLADNAIIHDFPLPTNEEIRKLITQSLSVSSWQATKIQERLNNNYYFIYQEIQKLKLAEKGSWTDEELKNVLPNYFEENNFNILNPLWKKDPNELLYTFRDILRTADKELTMAMLTTMIRKVLIASFLPNTTLSAIKPSQMSTAHKIRNEREILKQLYDAIIRIDTEEKQGESTGKIDAFLMALLSYCAAPESL